VKPWVVITPNLIDWSMGYIQLVHKISYSFDQLSLINPVKKVTDRETQVKT